MTLKANDRLNHFLAHNIVLNEMTELKDEIKAYKKGHTGYLLRALFVGSTATFLLSFLASVFGYGDPVRYLLITLLCNVIAIMINNVIFVCFLKRIQNERVHTEDFVFFMKHAIVQILCAVILSICQTFISSMFLQITAAIPALQAVTSIFISISFTFMNALIVFQIYDCEFKIKRICMRAIKLLRQNGKILCMISILFLCWSYAANIIFTNMFYQVVQVSGINNTAHALLQQQDYAMFTRFIGFYGIHYLIAGFLEIGMLLGLAILYRKSHSLKLK